MIQSYMAFFQAFQAGKELANAKTWKQRQLLGTALATFLGAGVVIAKGFGYDIPLDDATLHQIGDAVAVLVGAGNVVLTVVTSQKLGLPAKGGAAGDGGDGKS